MPTSSAGESLRRLLTAAVLAAVMGAAGLGLGYAIGIFAWLPGINGAAQSAWLASLTWTVWTTASAVVVAAVVASRHTDSSTGPAGFLERMGCVLSATFGGTVAAALVAMPSRGAHRPDTFAPHVIVAGHAIVGLILGLVLAAAAVNSAAISANVLATTIWFWLLAIVATVDTQVLQSGRWEQVDLGVWHFSAYGLWWHGMYLPAAGFALGAALLIGALTAWPAARRGEHIAVVIVSGSVGPVLVAAAYLLATIDQPGLFADQTSTRLIAAYATIAGMAGSLLAVMLSRPRQSRELDSAVPATS